MPRHISFALTTAQFRSGSKTVTRRMGWKDLKAGEVLCAVEKSQGIPKGEKVNKIGLIRIVSVRQERLDDMLDWRIPAEDDPDQSYGESECRREGFPAMAPADFVAFFCKSHKDCEPNSIVTRIEFVRVPAA